ncbi:hypothetical protein OIV83_005556 [Microbotryomycetes sp. JL201]|nr:hypothetical protein OIV83_005556 [Microbotryomycetes sp. JL201]
MAAARTAFRLLATVPRPTPARARAATLWQSPRAVIGLRRQSTAAPASQDSQLTDGERLLKSKLEGELAGAKVQVQDVSGGCGSFYAISISHPSFKGLTKMKQHRLVNELLKDEIKDMHGLQLKTSAE